MLSRPVSVIRPAPLSGEAIGVLLADAVGRELPGDVVLEAERLTEGNPLYVRDLADSLAAADDGAARDPLAMLRNAAPAAVGRRVQTGMARLNGAAQAVAKATAILGDEVPLRRAALLAGVEHEIASTAADALARTGIFAVAEPLRFRHPLVREAVLKSFESRARARAHAGAARLLIADGEPPERAAVHLLESDPTGDPDVVGTLRLAAGRAARQAAAELAIRSLERALRESPDPAERPLVLNELAVIETSVGKPHAFEHFREAFAEAEALEEMTNGVVPFALHLVAQGEFVKGQALIDRVCEALDDREQQLMLDAGLYTLAINQDAPSARGRLTRITESVHGDSPADPGRLDNMDVVTGVVTSAGRTAPGAKTEIP